MIRRRPLILSTVALLAALAGCASAPSAPPAVPRVAVMSAFQPELVLLRQKLQDAHTTRINGVEFIPARSKAARCCCSCRASA